MMLMLLMMIITICEADNIVIYIDIYDIRHLCYIIIATATPRSETESSPGFLKIPSFEYITLREWLDDDRNS